MGNYIYGDNPEAFLMIGDFFNSNYINTYSSGMINFIVLGNLMGQIYIIYTGNTYEWQHFLMRPPFRNLK